MAGDVVPDPAGGPFGWIVAGVVTVLGALGTFWAIIRKGKQEDTTTALTHANNIIKSHERYAKRRDGRIEELEEEIRRLWKALGDTTAREQLCVRRLEWLCGILRQHDIDVPKWPFDDDSALSEPGT